MLRTSLALMVLDLAGFKLPAGWIEDEKSNAPQIGASKNEITLFRLGVGKLITLCIKQNIHFVEATFEERKLSISFLLLSD